MKSQETKVTQLGRDETPGPSLLIVPPSPGPGDTDQSHGAQFLRSSWCGGNPNIPGGHITAPRSSQASLPCGVWSSFPQGRSLRVKGPRSPTRAESQFRHSKVRPLFLGPLSAVEIWRKWDPREMSPKGPTHVQAFQDS
jgi:hypothetical protein